MGSKIRKDLVGTVHVRGDGGDVLVLKAGDQVPDGYTVGDHLLHVKKEPEALDSDGGADDGTRVTASVPPVAPVVAVVEPPRSGAGSSKDAWATYATALEVDFSADATRDDIIAAVDASKAS